jgi:hypothetical protein
MTINSNDDMMSSSPRMTKPMHDEAWQKGLTDIAPDTDETTDVFREAEREAYALAMEARLPNIITTPDEAAKAVRTDPVRAVPKPGRKRR